MRFNSKQLSFTEKDFDEICKYLKDVLFSRKDYNVKSTIHDYFRDNTSYEDIIYIKWLRMVNNTDLSNLDSLLDMLNYSFFYADYLRKTCDTPHRNGVRLDKSKEEKAS